MQLIIRRAWMPGVTCSRALSNVGQLDPAIRRLMVQSQSANHASAFLTLYSAWILPSWSNMLSTTP